MLQELNIADIKVGRRHHKDLGDLTLLENSNRRDGLGS
jgi:hypothetical protein